MKKPTYKELEKKQKNMKIGVFGIIICSILATILFFQPLIEKQQERLSQCQADLNEAYFAEDINGNLYVGYFEGARVGYHQDYNGTWYQCKGRQDCEVIK